MASNQTTVSVRVRVSGPDLSEVTPWDEVAMRDVCEATASMVLVRAQRDRKLATGASMDSVPYSTKPTTIYLKSETARRLAPKGGVPVKNAAGVVIGRKYEGGYAQYKRESARAEGVTLTLSGQMFRSFTVKQVTAESGRVGLDGQPAEYGTYVDEARPWIGLSPDEVRAMDDIISEAVSAAMRRTVPGA